MRNPLQMFIACSFDSASKEEVNMNVQAVIDGENEYSNVIFEAFNNDRNTARHKLEDYLRAENPDFDVKSDDGMEACKRELKLQIQRLLAGKCSQVEFRSFFLEMESALMTDCDHFWGDLYAGCDCFDKNWKFLENDYLLEEAERVLQDL